MKRSKAFEKAVADYLTLMGIPYRRVEDYRCFACGQVLNASAADLPDFLAFPPNGMLCVECKTGKGRLTKGQKEMKALFEAAGIPWLTLRDNIDELMKVLNFEIRNKQ